jgi:alpha-L-rhamnosidase
MYNHVAGILPDGVGFKKIIVRPRPGGELTSAKLSYRSIRGMIVSDWKLENGKFILAVEVPANTTATVCLPSAAIDTATENGKPLKDAAAITSPRVEDGELKCNVGSGKYLFEIAYTPPPAPVN